MLEEVARAIRTHLEADLETKLDEVEAYWGGKGHALALPDPVSYELGIDPDVLHYERSEMPVVIATAHEGGPAGEHQQSGVTFADQADQWGYGGGEVLAVIVWHVDAGTASNAALYAWRYAKAVHEVLRDHERLDRGIRQQDYVKRVMVDPPSRQRAKTGSSAFYTALGQMLFAVSVRYN